MPLADIDVIEDDASEHKRDFAGYNDDLSCSAAIRTSGIS
jgi:hypothetical protein